ncbi:MAG: FAD-binding oxidoreductase [Terracidiphilus sp.]
MDIRRNALADIVGAVNVIDDPRILEGYASDCSAAPRRNPRFVVHPQNATQVQALVTWANQTHTGLVPVSSGAPHFYGDTVPSQPGSIIVDLSGMKQIKRIDRRNKMVVIEPGVTYAELKPALAKEGLRISQPLLPRRNKSVVASLLERQPTTIPRFNFSLPEPLRNCGVVWGSGEIAFTGESGNGIPDLEEQWKLGGAQVDPKGPNATDLMRLLTGAQGTMGIVIWASVKCELIPAASHSVFVASEKLEDLIDFCYQEERIRIGDEMMCVNAPQLATMMGDSANEIGRLKAKLPAWTVMIRLAGAGHFPSERVEVQRLDLGRLAQKCGLTLQNSLASNGAAELEKAFESDSGDTYYKLKYKGGCREVFFLTTLDKAPQFVSNVFAIAERNRYDVTEIGVYIQPQHQGVSQHVEFSFPYDPGDTRGTERIDRIYAETSEVLMSEGAYFSRPYGAWAEMIYSRDATATKILRVVKGIVDPKNVLNPGKLCF